MSKAVLVIDMPKNCAECDICSGNGYCMKTNEFCTNRQEKRQDWCPLVLMPERVPKDGQECFGELKYMDGWNAVIDMIGGKDNVKP